MAFGAQNTVGGKFERPPAAAPGSAQAPKQRTSRYKGIMNGEDKIDMPNVGQYVFRILSLSDANETRNAVGSTKLYVENVQCDANQFAVGTKLKCVFMHTDAGLKELGHAIMNAGGFESRDAFNAFDPDGWFIDTLLGDASTEYAKRGETVIGRLVYCECTRGNPVLDKVTKQPTGGWYRNYAWTVVPEEQQDMLPRVADQAAFFASTP